MSQRKRCRKIDLSNSQLPDEVKEAVVLVLQRRPPIDVLIFYARWHEGMTFAEIADRVLHTTEYVRLRLNSIYTAVRKEYEKSHAGKYVVSTIEEEENAVETSEGPNSNEGSEPV